MKIEEFNNKYQKTILNTQKNMKKNLRIWPGIKELEFQEMFRK